MTEQPFRLTLQLGTREHSAFGTAIELAQEELKYQGWDEGFMETAAGHKKFFDPNKDYTLLTKDFQYIMDLSTQALGRQSRGTTPVRH
jgi:hypothetical protein